MSVFLALSIFVFSMIAALSGIYRKFQTEKFRGEYSSIRNKLILLCRCNSRIINEKSELYNTLNAYLSGKFTEDDRIFIELRLQEHLATLPSKVERQIIDLIQDAKVLIKQYALKTSFQSIGSYIRESFQGLFRKNKTQNKRINIPLSVLNILF